MKAIPGRKRERRVPDRHCPAIAGGQVHGQRVGETKGGAIPGVPPVWESGTTSSSILGRCAGRQTAAPSPISAIPAAEIDANRRLLAGTDRFDRQAGQAIPAPFTPFHDTGRISLDERSGTPHGTAREGIAGREFLDPPCYNAENAKAWRAGFRQLPAWGTALGIAARRRHPIEIAGGLRCEKSSAATS